MTTEIDRTLLRLFQSDLAEALKPLAEKYGISLKPGSASFTPKNFTAQIVGAVVGDNGEVATREAEDFKKYAVMFGLKPDDLGRNVVLHGGATYRIAGLKPGSQKMPVLCERNKDHKMFKFTVDAVKRALQPAVPEIQLKVQQ